MPNATDREYIINHTGEMETYGVKLETGPELRAPTWTDVLRHIRYGDVVRVSAYVDGELSYRINVSAERQAHSASRR